MLLVDLRGISRGPITTEGTLAADDPRFENLEGRLTGPVAVSGRLMETAPGSYYWDGRVAASLELRCRRCLTRVPVVLDQRIRALFTEDDEAGDPAAYIIPHRAAELDLRDAVREELLLAVPGRAARGVGFLCQPCGQNL